MSSSVFGLSIAGPAALPVYMSSAVSTERYTFVLMLA